MGSRRLGRKRLFALDKVGQSFTSSSAGAGISDSIGNYKGSRDGSLVTTDIQIDLANSTAVAYAYSASALGRVIGASSSAASAWPGGGTNPHSNAQIARVGSEHGVVTSVEMICVEAPTGGPTSIGLAFGSAVSASNELATAGTAIVAYTTTQVVGRDDATAYDANNLDGKYLYLVNSGSNGGDAAYTAGKFIIRLHGYAIPEDL